jgi:tetratricopeptide (TPR) repeat protein
MAMRDTSFTSSWKTSAVGLAALLSILLIAGCGRKSAEDYLKSGDHAMQSSGFSQAEADYQQAVQLAPQDPRTHVALANAYLAEKKPDQARGELMKALELDLKNPGAHAALGDLYLAESQPQGAEDQFRAAVALDPGNASYRIKLAQALTRANKLGPAEVELRTAIGLEPRNAAAHYALASLLFAERGREEEAQAEMAAAQALNPSLAIPSPMASPAAAAAPPTAPGPAAAAPKIRPISKRFQLTKNSPVYQTPDQGSAVVGQVHRRRWVNVIGITGDWLQIRLRNGTVGFIPTAAAE